VVEMALAHTINSKVEAADLLVTCTKSAAY
jgi:hypothetical protein